MIDFLRRLFCSHHSRESVLDPITGPGWVGTVSRTHCLLCGKQDVR